MEQSSKINSYLKSPWLLIFYLVVVFRLWIMPLGASLWLDETLTYWDVMKGVKEIVARTSTNADQFPLYILITALSSKLIGLNELGLRFPSFIASLFSSWLVFRLGSRLFNTETGVYAAIMFVCTPAIYPHASNARPYSLVVLFSLLSVWHMVKLHDTGKWYHGAAYALSAAAMVYVHVVSIPFLFVLLMYSALHLKELDKKHKYILLKSHFAMLALLAPIYYKAAMAIIANYESIKNTYKVLSADKVPFEYLIIALFSKYTLIVIAVILIAVLIEHNSMMNYIKVSDTNFIFVMLWFIIPAVSIYSISSFIGIKVFLYRYYITSYIGLNFILASSIQRIHKISLRHTAFMLSCFTGFFFCENMKIAPLEDWRGALAYVNRIVEPTQIPLLINCGLAETLQPGWEHQTPNHYLLSPLSAYPVNTRVVALPVKLDETSRPYLESNIAEAIDSVKAFVVVLRVESNSESVDQWIRVYATQRGFSRHENGEFRRVFVVYYEKDKA